MSIIGRDFGAGLNHTEVLDIYQRGRHAGDGAGSIYVSHLKGLHHVPHPARPQCRRPRPGDHVLLELFNTAPNKSRTAMRTLPSPSRRSSWCFWRILATAARSTTWGSRWNRVTRSIPRSHASSGEGLFTDSEEMGTVLLLTQDKVWVTGPEAKSGRSTPSSPIRKRSVRPHGTDPDSEGVCCGSQAQRHAAGFDRGVVLLTKHSDPRTCISTSAGRSCSPHVRLPTDSIVVNIDACRSQNAECPRVAVIWTANRCLLQRLLSWRER